MLKFPFLKMKCHTVIIALQDTSGLVTQRAKIRGVLLVLMEQQYLLIALSVWMVTFLTSMFEFK